MQNFSTRLSMFCLAACAALGSACGAPVSDKDPVETDFTELASLDEKSDAFSWRMKLVGALSYGETSATVKYKNPPRYRAFSFQGSAGDAVTAQVRSSNGGDAVAWIVNARYDVIAYNDDAPGSLDSFVEATLPANFNANNHTYYVIFREYSLKSKSFTVELTGPSTCDYNGATYQLGDSFPSSDGCNTCFCGAGGSVGCTKRACISTCEYGGQTYHAGDEFPATDGCNTCTCSPNGQVGCTKIACPVCDSANDANRSYVSRDVTQCAATTFLCQPGLSMFFDACGCGCEQPSDCPAWINCMPGPGPSTCAAERARCPLSQVAY